MRIATKEFVGRDEELRALVATSREVADGANAVSLIRGDAGSGKSRIVHELQRALGTADGFLVGNCVEYAQSPFAPVLEILRTGHEHLRAGDRRRQLDALLEALRALAVVRPIVAVLEDIHWADQATLDLIEHAVVLRGIPQLHLVATYRSSDVGRLERLRTMLAVIERAPFVHKIELEPLSPNVIRRLLESALDGARPPPAAIIETIIAQSDGNPLFAEELLKHALDGLRADKAVSDVPLTIRELTLGRVANLSEDDRRRLQHAAVLGLSFSSDDLVAVADGSVDDVHAFLRSMCQSNFFLEDAATMQFAFAHELSRRAVYDDVLALDRRTIHRRVAQYRERHGRGSFDDAAVGHHYWEAGDRAKAGQFLERAGDRATALHAYGDAVSLYERTLDAGSHRSEAPLLEKLARAHEITGQPARAVAANERALALYAQAANTAKMGELLVQLGLQSIQLADAPAALEKLEAALGLLPPDSPLRFTVHVTLANAYVSRDLGDLAKEHLTLAERFERNDDPVVLARFFETRGAIRALDGDLAGFQADFNDSIRAAEATGQPSIVVNRWRNFGDTALPFGEFGLARECFDHALEIGADFEGVSALAVSYARLAELRFRLGELHAARDLIDRARERAPEMPLFWVALATTAVPIALDLEDESLLAAFELDSFVEIAFRSQDGYRIGSIMESAVEVRLAQGRREAVPALLTRAVGALHHVPALVPLLRLIAAHGRPEEVGRMLEILSQQTTPAAHRAVIGARALCSAILGERLGRRDQKREAALEAIELFAAIGWRQREAEALEILGARDRAIDIYRAIGNRRALRRLAAQ